MATNSLSKKNLDTALNNQRSALFQAMGIVRMASQSIREPGYDNADVDAWTALDAAYEVMSGVADRLGSSKALFATEVARGEY